MQDPTPDQPAVHPEQTAGQDHAILKTLESDPASPDAQLDRGLDESMDASDPPTAVQPGDSGDAHPSSGFDPEKEAEIQSDRQNVPPSPD